MPDSELEKHYEENYKSPLWSMVKNHAEQKDISYYAAYREILPEYQKTIRYKDAEWVKQQIRKRNMEMIKQRKTNSR